MRIEVKKGQWYTQCCYLDLDKADEDICGQEDFDLYEVWDSLEDAIKELRTRFNAEDQEDIDKKYLELKEKYN